MRFIAPLGRNSQPRRPRPARELRHKGLWIELAKAVFASKSPLRPPKRPPCRIVILGEDEPPIGILTVKTFATAYKQRFLALSWQHSSPSPAKG